MGSERPHPHRPVPDHSHVGAGGMGTVFLGEHMLLGRRAAIKTLAARRSRSHKTIVERFFTEARAISAISDPGVVQIFDFGYAVDGTAYIVMEYLEGEPLSARIDRLGVLPLGDALRIARQVAGSLGPRTPRHRPPRPQAREHLPRPRPRGARRRAHEDARLRHLQARRRRRRARRPRPA